MTTAILAHAPAETGTLRWTLRLSTSVDVARIVAQVFGSSREEVEAKLTEFRAIAAGAVVLCNELIADFHMGDTGWQRTIGDYDLVTLEYQGNDVARTILHSVTAPAT